jgi:hypothetical protein
LYSRIIYIQLASDKAFSISPNPAVTYARLSIFAEKADQAKLFVYKVSGELVYTGNYKLSAGFNTISLQDISKWPSGMYMVRVNSPFINYWQKLIVRR